MGMASVGIVRAEGVRVTSAVSTDLVLLQRVDSTVNGQYSPRLITANNLVTSAVTSGTATLVAGTVTVNTTAVITAGSKIILTREAANASTAIGDLSVGIVTAGTSFVINSLAADATVATGDLSTVAWILF